MVRLLSRNEQRLFLTPQGLAIAWSRAISSATLLPSDELRVFQFIAVRTLRFNNRIEKISIEEFLNGARRHQRLVAASVGLNREQLQSAIERLLLRRAIIREHIAGACFYGIDLEWFDPELAPMPIILNDHYNYDEMDVE